MLGFPLFAIAFGQEHVSRIAMCDLGEIVFTFAVLLPLLEARSGGAVGARAQASRLARNPVIWALTLGLAVGVSGAGSAVSETAVGSALRSCLGFIAAPTGVLILFAIGYELDFSRKSLASSSMTILIRYLLWVPLFFLAWAFVARFAPGADSVLRSAFMVLFILPPTFAIPVFAGGSGDGRAIATTISLNSLVAVLLLSAVAMFA